MRWALCAGFMLCACGAPIVRAPVQPFSCRGQPAPPEEPPPARLPIDARPARRFELRRTDDRHGDLESVRLAMVADDAPLSSVTIALAESAGIEIVLDPELAAARVTLLRSGSLEEVMRAVTDAAGALFAREGDAFLIETARTARLRNLRRIESTEQRVLETRLVPVHSASPVQIATAYCATYASARGSAAVVGDQLVVMDVSSAIDGLEELVAAIDHIETRTSQ